MWPFRKNNSDSFPPTPAWKPCVPVDIDRTTETFAYYTDRSARFAVFENGTCIAVRDQVSDTELHAKSVLDQIYNFHPDFNPMEMDDGNFMVTFSQPGSASIVFIDEFEANRDYIDENHLDGVVRDEVLLNADNQPNTFDDRGKIGLFGRARMFLDAEDPVVIRIWTPS